MMHLAVVKPVIVVSGDRETLRYWSTNSYIHQCVGYLKLAKFLKYINFVSNEPVEPA